MKKIAWMLVTIISLLSFAPFVQAMDGLFDGSHYGSFAGTVVNVTQGDTLIVMLEGADGGRASFVIMPETYWMEGMELSDGGQAQIFYVLSPIAPLIFPPQYIAAVVAPVTEGEAVFVGRFNERLVSLDNQLQLLNMRDAEVLTIDGEPYGGDLAGHTLAVVYGPSTRSIPAQTTPLRVTVLDDGEKTE